MCGGKQKNRKTQATYDLPYMQFLLVALWRSNACMHMGNPSVALAKGKREGYTVAIPPRARALIATLSGDPLAGILGPSLGRDLRL